MSIFEKPTVGRLIIRPATRVELAGWRVQAYEACVLTRRRMIIAPLIFLCVLVFERRCVGCPRAVFKAIRVTCQSTSGDCSPRIAAGQHAPLPDISVSTLATQQCLFYAPRGATCLLVRQGFRNRRHSQLKRLSLLCDRGVARNLHGELVQPGGSI